MLLNIDLAELEEESEELAQLASIASVCCGAHAGGPAQIRRTLGWCRRWGTAVAAHPSYPDRENFGRKKMEISELSLMQSLRLQLLGLRELAAEEGLRVEGLKPHGALYQAVATEPALGKVLWELTLELLGEVWVIGPPGGTMGSCARDYRVECFADRGYREDGSLIPRDTPGALLQREQVLPQLRQLRAGGLYQVVCLHGDGAHALDLARAVRKELDTPVTIPPRSGG